MTCPSCCVWNSINLACPAPSQWRPTCEAARTPCTLQNANVRHSPTQPFFSLPGTRLHLKRNAVVCLFIAPRIVLHYAPNPVVFQKARDRRFVALPSRPFSSLTVCTSNATSSFCVLVSGNLCSRCVKTNCPSPMCVACALFIFTSPWCPRGAGLPSSPPGRPMPATLLGHRTEQSLSHGQNLASSARQFFV